MDKNLILSLPTAIKSPAKSVMRRERQGDLTKPVERLAELTCLVLLRIRIHLYGDFSVKP